MQGAPEPVARVEDIHPAGGVRMRVYRPAGQRPGERPPVLLFAHAGGWCLVSLDAGDTPCRALANATGCVVISVDYRLAPEHPYPTPLEDYYRALVWVAEQAERLGVDAARLIVGGDSAGANLAAGAALLARDRHGPAIAHQLLLYPPLDVDFDTPSYRAHGEGCYLTRAAMRWCWQTYLGAAWPCPPAYAAPLRADPAGLPSATLAVNEYDPLRSEGEAYAHRLAAAGVAVDLIRLDGLVHASLHMAGIAPAAGQIVPRIAAALQTRFGPRP